MKYRIFACVSALLTIFACVLALLTISAQSAAAVDCPKEIERVCIAFHALNKEYINPLDAKMEERLLSELFKDLDQHSYVISPKDRETSNGVMSWVMSYREQMRRQKSFVRGKLLKNDFAYVSLAEFSPTAGADVKKEIAWLSIQLQGKLRGLVLDLRNNPGGDADGAQELASIFLRKGVVLRFKYRNEEKKYPVLFRLGDILEGKPLIVLVNEGSQSASEVVAGALQDHKRAMIMGMPTKGKGTAQRLLYDTEANYFGRYTIAYTITPNGRVIEKAGIIPDYIIPALENSSSDIQLERAISELERLAAQK